MSEGEIHGFCDPRFEPLEALFREHQRNGMNEGACLAATLGGEPVVDLWGGFSDRDRTKRWERDTLCLAFSTSKVMLNIALLMVYDRGLIDLDAPIATYWPEFGQGGKATITTRQVLTHQTGVPGFGRQLTLDELHDWEFMLGVTEESEVWCEPGTSTWYSPHVYGFALAGLIERVTGQPFADFFREELAQPLDADYHFGLKDPADHARVASLWPVPMEDLPDLALNLPMVEVEPGNWMTAERMAGVVPSTNGWGNARSVARIAAVLASGGEVDGRRYLGRAVVEEASREQNWANDQMMGWIRYGLGFGLHSDAFLSPTPTTFHCGVFGDSATTMDLTTGLAVSFIPNRLAAAAPNLPEVRLRAYLDTIGEVSRALT
jgi:CubicO group peptidase (beta-lactamase class C family)